MSIPYVSPAYDDLTTRVAETNFHNRFLTLTVTVPANDSTQINVLQRLGGCANRIIGYITDVTDLVSIRFNDINTSDYPLSTVDSKLYLDKVLINQVDIINTDVVARTAVILLSRYQNAPRTKQAGM